LSARALFLRNKLDVLGCILARQERQAGKAGRIGVPTYEYECEDCGKEFEYFQSMSEAPKTVCVACGGKLKRLVSAGSGLIFKGSGFYITDYKGKSPDIVKKTDSKPAETSGGDSKPSGESSGKSSGESSGKSSDSGSSSQEKSG
jgi:putative FmdB family regulatory protein